jgi:DNA replication protein DnaC
MNKLVEVQSGLDKAHPPVKPVGDLVGVIDWDNPPKDKWKCDVCHEENDNWLPTVSALFNEPGPLWRPGICPHCTAKDERMQLEVAEAEKQEKRKNRILALHRAAALPKEMAYVKFAELQRVRGAEEAFDELAELDIEKDRTWLCLTGMNNTGKSRLLAATSNRQNGRYVPTLYINESLFFKQVKESWESNEESKVMGIFKLADVVLWDEFLIFDYTKREWIYERAYALLEYLAEMDKKVIFATNIMNIRSRSGQESIEGMCGRRIWARLQRRNTRYIQMKNEPFHH